MADTDDSRPSGPPRKPGGWRGFLGRMLLKLGVEPPLPLLEPNRASEDLVEHAQAFHDLRVEDVMKPRADILALDMTCTFEEVVAHFAEAEHSRMPVYRENLDDPVGVVHVKDIFKLLAAAPSRRPKPRDPVLQRRRHLVRKALYVPVSMRASELLGLMRSSHSHMALVIDEFGGTDGLVTLEDLLERLVGEIADEHDEADDAGPPIVEDEGGWMVDGRVLVEDLEAAMGGVDLAPPDVDEEIDTVAGLVTVLAGRVPRPRERIPHPGGFAFEVAAADPRRVKRVRVHRPPTAPIVELDA
ncbi:MAG: hemolysin family protein [Phenylobacterium sp.]|uniref:hemolysin family protein n=1 Tax=Phenylobacterium sp. TaxID=1871053 RepID=UPI002737097D|nr:hemolysin family protein [Phenylobacterium sp.]MDP3174613.1 hemolysin family protein [Phenylobacterium sp.]